MAAQLRDHDLAKALESLPWRERRVLELRYGLAGDAPMTLEDIGTEVGVTRERVRQIESKTLAKLKYSEGGEKLKGTTDNIVVAAGIVRTRTASLGSRPQGLAREAIGRRCADASVDDAILVPAWPVVTLAGRAAAEGPLARAPAVRRAKLTRARARADRGPTASEHRLAADPSMLHGLERARSQPEAAVAPFSLRAAARSSCQRRGAGAQARSGSSARRA